MVLFDQISSLFLISFVNIFFSFFFFFFLIVVEEKRKRVQRFLSTQKQRIGIIEGELLEATNEILPPSSESKTITELAELCRLTQNVTVQKFDNLRSRLEEAGYTVSSSPTAASNNNNRRPWKSTNNRLASPPPNYHSAWPTVIGGPLESVVEAEYETDGATTPGSYLQSPAPSSTSFISNFTNSASTNKKKQRERRKSCLTPTTPPTMDRLSFSASTSKLLQTMDTTKQQFFSDDDNQGNSNQNQADREHNHRRRSTTEFNFRHQFEFRDEDDMITLDTQSTMTKNVSPVRKSGNYNKASPPSKPAIEEKTEFFTRMEGMLDRVEETILEEDSPRGFRNEPSRPSDEIKASLRMQTYSPEKSLQSIESSFNGSIQNKYSCPKTNRSDSFTSMNDSSHYDDDSTNVVATQVAEINNPVLPNQQVIPGLQDSNKTPTHILVDRAMASPAHTNITMDATVMNETYTSFLVTEENLKGNVGIVLDRNDSFDDNDDNLSTVTPILDRYRLDPDDNSIGVKVVPNERRSHHKETRRRSTAGISPKRKESLPIFLPSNFLSPPPSHGVERNPGSGTSRQRKVYRKTPFPKNKAYVNYEEETNHLPPLKENDHPNLSVDSTGTSSPPFLRTVGATNSTAFSIPPLRPRSFEPRRVGVGITSSSARKLSFPTHETPKSGRAGSDGSMIDLSSGRVDGVGKSFFNQAKALSPKQSRRNISLMQQVTDVEFEAAPRIVRTQVTLNEVNDALELISLRLSDKKPSSRFSEEEGHNLIMSLTGTQQRSKSILISLCHFQRLVMKRDMDDRSILFAINDDPL